MGASERRTMSRLKIEQSGHPISDIMTVAETAQFLRITPYQVYDLTRARGRARSTIPIPVLKFSKQLRFRKSSLQAWMEALEKAG